MLLCVPIRPHLYSCHLQILGRATELNSFVKMQTSEGFVEIELKGKPGKGNVVIRRKLSAKSKSSSFTMDGQPATGREVTQKMSELNIQVGSLWYVQFMQSY